MKSSEEMTRSVMDKIRTAQAERAALKKRIKPIMSGHKAAILSSRGETP